MANWTKTLIFYYSRCERCGHEWKRRRSELPKVCPKCKSRLWNELLNEYTCDGIGNVVCTPSCADCPVYKSWEQSVQSLRKKALPPAASSKSTPNQILARKLRADAAWEKVRIQAQQGQVKE